MKNAFTLIEIIIVIVIIATLVAICVPIFNNMVIIARFAQVENDVAQCNLVFTLWQQKYGLYTLPYQPGMTEIGNYTSIADLPSNSGPFYYGVSTQYSECTIMVYTGSFGGNMLVKYISYYAISGQPGRAGPEGTHVIIWEVNLSHPWGQAISGYLKSKGEVVQ